MIHTPASISLVDTPGLVIAYLFQRVSIIKHFLLGSYPINTPHQSPGHICKCKSPRSHWSSSDRTKSSPTDPVSESLIALVESEADWEVDEAQDSTARGLPCVRPPQHQQLAVQRPALP